MSDMTTHDGKVPLPSNMQPNRKTRRAQQRQAKRNHAKKMGERQRHEPKKGRQKRFAPTHARGSSAFAVQFARVICYVNRAIKFLCVVGTTLLKLMVMFFVKALVAYSSSTEARTAVRKLRSDAVTDKMTTVRTEEAASSDTSRHGEESTSDEVSGTRHSLPF